MGNLKDENHPVKANAYAVAVATMENNKKNDYSIPPSIEPPFTDPTKRRKIRKEGETTSTLILSKVLLRILHATSYYGKNGDPKSEEHGTFNGCMMFLNKSMSNGDCGMFLIKYVEYLMHDLPFSSLTGARIDWFREKMTTKLFYFKNLPM
ncbi:hypothetical protein AAG906_012046 [Vitis piasezkii]